MELHNAVKKHGGIKPAARELGISPSTLRRRLEKERRESFKSFTLPEGKRYEATSGPRYFIITSAQDKTEIHKDFWNNLKAYSEYLSAEIIVGGFTYSKRLFMENDPRMRNEDVWFHEEVEPYIVHDRIALGDNLLFCAEMNTLPTAVQPLSGLETYTKEKWGIFPHAKVQLRSIATMKFAPAKQIMTTGAVTLPNYIRKKAGVKAEFHHMIGAIVASIAPDGAFFCRHILANDLEDGSFYDLNRYVSGGVVYKDQRPEAIVHGDVHIEKVDPVVARTSWGYDAETGHSYLHEDNLTNLLRPKARIFHDLVDFSARNHHTRYDHHHRFHSYFHGRENVKRDIQLGADFLSAIRDHEVRDIVIQSNHDNALLKWVKSADSKNDPENYEFWLECELKCIKALKENREIHLFEEVMRELGVPHYVEFAQEDKETPICDVELAIHGHRGANGGRGSPNTFSKMGPKSITAHTHTPSITDGHMCVGTNCKLDMGYNMGLSSWSHTNALLYSNGHRTLITMMNGRWFD